MGEKNQVGAGLKPAPTDEIRSFIAIDISVEVRRALDAFIREMKPTGRDVKWVKVEGVHLTLKFLGNISKSMIPKVKDAMEKASTAVAPFEVKVEGAGAFPNMRKPRVFWTGLIEPTGKLAALAKRLDEEMKPLGFAPEMREFKPHLTLGRTRQGGKPDASAEFIQKSQAKVFGAFQANSLILFRSELKPDGAVYSKLAEITFKRR